MSFPEYLNRIINSQLKNKEIETVRTEITKLVSHRIRRDRDDQVEPPAETSKKIEMPKTITNFFNIHSAYRNSESKIEPRKTFSEVHIGRLKKRLTLQQEAKGNKEIAEPQETSMKDWREEMIKHLKVPVKNQLISPKQEIMRLSQLQESKKDFYQEKRKLKGARLTASSSSFKRAFLKERVKEHEGGEIRASSQKNIILIRPQPISEEELQEKRVPKLRKINFKQKRSPLKNEALQEDEYSVQRLANFTALLPFLGTQKAKVQSRQQKKPKIMVIQEAQKQKIELRVPYKRVKKIPEQVIEISGWQIEHQL